MQMKSLKRLTPLLVVFVLVLAAPAQQPPKPKVPDALRPSAQAEDRTVHKDLAYGPHERNKLDLYLPSGDAPKPLIIWVHGGAWMAGSKDMPNPALRFRERGYAVA